MSMKSSATTQVPNGVQSASFYAERGVGVLTAWGAGTFAAILGFSRLSYGLLLPALRASLGGSYSIYGTLGTLNFIGYLLGTMALPFILPRVRRRLSFNLLSLCAMNLTLLAASLSFTLWQLGVWRLLNGIFAAFATVLTIALTLECVPVSRRGMVSGLLWAGGAAGIVLSGLLAPFILAAGSNAGWRIVWIGMASVGVIMACGFVLTRRRMPLLQEGISAEQVTLEARRVQPVQKPLLAILRPLFEPRRLLFLTLSYGSFGCGYIIYFTFFVALLEQQGVSALNAGFIWAAIGVAGSISGWLWGRVLDRWPTGYALALSLLLGALGALSVLTHNRGWEYAGAALVGLTGSISPALMVTALLKRAVADAEYATSLSVLTAFFALGQIVGPLVSSQIVSSRGLIAGTASSAFALGIAAVCACGYGVVQGRAK